MRLQPVTTTLLVHETPPWYAPRRARASRSPGNYHHRQRLQPQIFTSANVGPKWTLDWLRFVQEDATGVAMQPFVWV